MSTALRKPAAQPKTADHKSRTIRRILDLFCCEGGAAHGYALAGFKVYGVDLFKHKDAKGRTKGFSQKRYRHPSYQGDVIDVLVRLIAGEKIPFTAPDGTVEHLGLDDFEAIHASPPCQRHSAGTRAITREEYPDLIGPTRELLIATGKPYIIENVPGAPLLDSIELCGSMFDLRAEDEDGVLLHLKRHRQFESNIEISVPTTCNHQSPMAGVYGGARSRKPGQSAAEHRRDAREERGGGYVPQSLEVCQNLLGIDWMTKGGMNQSIPPAYSRHLGEILMDHIDSLALAA